MSDAIAIVLSRFNLRETTTKHAMMRAKKDGILLRRGRLYVWTEIVQERVAERLKQVSEEQEHAPDTSPAENALEIPEIQT